MTKIKLPENPYGTDVHLDAGVYDGLYRRVFNEALQQFKEILEKQGLEVE